MKKLFPILLGAMGFFPTIGFAGSETLTVTIASGSTQFPDKMDRTGYAIGLEIATGLKNQGIEFNVDKLHQAMKDVLTGATPLMTMAEAREVKMAIFNELREKQMAAQKKAGESGLADAKKFLDENKGKEGVKATASGLQYKVLTEGTGVAPTASSTVSVHYRGTLLNGTEFDSSHKRNEPAEFPVGGVIKGWTEALMLMKVGSKLMLWIPPDLAYGEHSPTPMIPPNSLLTFEVELLAIK